MRVLGIETSCDETAVAVYDGVAGLLAHEVYSQVELHAAYGGVVPELASRDHLRKLLPLLKKTLESCALGGAVERPVDGIACTVGPGLVGALLVGSAVARSLAYAWRVPFVGVHHMEGHLLAPLLEQEPPAFPFVALLVSGGHTLLALVHAVGSYEILGSSLDDAAGEAFDKTAKLLGLGYPGGPQLAALAERGRPGAFVFPRPMTDRPGLDFSFSGLKTAVVVALRGRSLDEQTRADAALAFQEAVVDTLVIKAARAIEATGAKDTRDRRWRGRQPASQGPDARDGRARRGAGRIPSRGVLHGQRGDDRPARPPAAGGRPGRRPGDPCPGALADDRARAAVAEPAVLTDRVDIAVYPPSTIHCLMPTATTKSHDIIFLGGLTTECIIGIWDWERRVKQKIVLDIEMASDIRKAAASDHIDDTLDYKRVSKRLLQFVGDSQFQLVETLTERIAEIVVTEFDVPWVRVRLNKQGAIRGSRDVGILVERRREDYDRTQATK